ncbi:P-loop containing nucleoside triphosphate hydrolase protein [Tribonema minus]|uniref:RNA helicase n=1 Tax=Tribonema minus TaxID=303371 RepID=A0A835Z7A7_9STRA|nr:P-loop containing nucleoside triphosphate hydrolase protein [Tribonema minus]
MDELLGSISGGAHFKSQKTLQADKGGSKCVGLVKPGAVLDFFGTRAPPNDAHKGKRKRGGSVDASKSLHMQTLEQNCSTALSICTVALRAAAHTNGSRSHTALSLCTELTNLPSNRTLIRIALNDPRYHVACCAPPPQPAAHTNGARSHTAPAAAAPRSDGGGGSSGGSSASEESDGQHAAELFQGVRLAAPAAAAKRKRRRGGQGGAAAEVEELGEARPVTAVAQASAAEKEEIAAFRRRLGIKVEGSDVPAPLAEFSQLPAAKTRSAAAAESAAHARGALLSAIEASDWTEPTPVQMQAIPAMAEGRDVLAAAPTGSGKTAAYVIPALMLLGGDAVTKGEGIRALLLAPTRELAAQIHREVERLAAGRKLKACVLSKALVAGSRGQGGLAKNDILICTPMRAVAALRSGALTLTRVRLVVLDEADKLFDAGREGQAPEDTFIAQVDELLAACPSTAQRALFSATLGPHVKELATSVLRDPVSISIGTPNAGASTIDQKLVFVGREEGKLLAIRQALFRELVYDGLNVDAIHADRTPEQRAKVIAKFRSGDLWVLICTDLMGRGIDFKGVNMVINYDLPQSAVAYVHRIGRTGRTGMAVTLFTEKHMVAMRSIISVLLQSSTAIPLNMFNFNCCAVGFCRLCGQDGHGSYALYGEDMDTMRSIANVVLFQSSTCVPLNIFNFNCCAVGFAGRAGRTGTAVTLFTEKDMDAMRSIANVVKLSGCEVPEWMLSMKRLSSKDKRRLQVSAPRRTQIETVSKYDKKQALKKKKLAVKQKLHRRRETDAQGSGDRGGASETGAEAGVGNGGPVRRKWGKRGRGGKGSAEQAGQGGKNRHSEPES